MELRKGRILVLLALCALMLGVSAAQAQVTYQITSTPTFVINTGRAEVVGSVRITAINTGPTIASTIQFLYQGVSCDNDTTSGITLTTGSPAGPGTGAFSGAGVTTFSAAGAVTNTSAGCVVAVTVLGGVAVAPGDYIEIGGVRGRIDFLGGITNVGQNVFASLNATPSNSSLFTAPSTVVVGTTAVGLEVVSVTATSTLQCVPAAATPPSITVREGYNGAFVQHDIGPGAQAVPLNFRTNFGGNENTQVRLVLSGVPSGVTITWPTTVDSSLGVYSDAGDTGSALVIAAGQSNPTSSAITYEYVCGNQGSCDLSQETFVITPTSVTVTPTAAFGTGTIQARLFPDLITGDATAITSAPAATTAPRPRFNDPLRPTPAAAFVTNSSCRTSLLFPWLVNIANFDSGVAIANTSLDPFTALGAPATTAQSGTCTLTGWRNTDAVSVSFTSGSIAAGTTFTLVLSDPANAVFNGFAGYVIAVCNFQYAHGFAFLVENPAAPRVAEGYVALVIPDPVLNAGRRARTAGSGLIAQEGEGLNQ